MDTASFKAAFQNAFPVRARGLFDDLIWPAAAGNVAWAFLQVAIGTESDHRALRLALLLLLATYLAIDWFRSKSLEHKTPLYWIADSIHIASIVTYGVALASDKSGIFLEYNLAVIFGIAVLGHLVGAWEVSGQPRNWHHRASLASCGLLGIAVLLAGRWVTHAGSLQTLLVAFVTVLIAWILTRVFIAAKPASLAGVQNSQGVEPGVA